jgi:SAM-dependent methyltransferase
MYVTENSDHKLLGTAATVADAFEGSIRIESMYGPAGSALYHSFTLRDNAEIDELLAAADGRSGPVLELCCGSGRITLPLLRAGYEVVGLDNSLSMLGLLAGELDRPENAALADRLSTVVADMADFDLDRKFDLVVLGATAIWNLTEEQRATLFGRVREHLTDDGRFLFTALTFDGLEGAAEPLENISLFVSRTTAEPALCTFIDYAEPNGLRSTNILCQTLADGRIVDTAMYTAWSYLATPSALAAEVERTGLRMVARHDVNSRHRITRSNRTAGRRRLLFEVAR